MLSLVDRAPSSPALPSPTCGNHYADFIYNFAISKLLYWVGKSRLTIIINKKYKNKLCVMNTYNVSLLCSPLYKQNPIVCDL